MKARVVDIIESNDHLSEGLETARDHGWKLYEAHFQLIVPNKELGGEVADETIYVFADDEEDAEYMARKRIDEKPLERLRFMGANLLSNLD